MQAPEQFLMGRRRILFALLATGVLALTAGLFFAHRPTPHTEIVWLSPAQVARAFIPSPWARLKARVWKLARRLSPSLRPPKAPTVVISFKLWHSSPAEGPPGQPISTNAQGVLAWKLSPAEIERAEMHSITFSWEPWQELLGNMRAPSGQHGTFLLEDRARDKWGILNNLQVDASATCAAGSNRFLFVLTPVGPQGGPPNSLINSVLGCRALVPNGGGVLLRNAGAESTCCSLLLTVEAVDSSGNRIAGPPAR